MGCSPEELRRHIEAQWLPGMSWDNWGIAADCWQIDHRRNISAFDLSDDAQRAACFHWSNLQPLWARDNSLKRTPKQLLIGLKARGALLTAEQLIRIIPHLTARMLTYWEEEEVLRPISKAGHKRWYTFHLAVCTAIIVSLRRRRVRLSHIAIIVRRFRESNFQFRGDQWLVTDGQRYRITDSQSKAIEFGVRSRRGVHLVSVGEHMRLVTIDIKE